MQAPNQQMPMMDPTLTQIIRDMVQKDMAVGEAQQMLRIQQHRIKQLEEFIVANSLEVPEPTPMPQTQPAFVQEQNRQAGALKALKRRRGTKATNR